MKPLIIFDLDGTLYSFDDSENSDFQSSNFYREIKKRAYNFIIKKFNVDKNRAEQIYEKTKKDFNGEVSLGMEFRYRIDRYNWFEEVWDLEPKNFIKKENKKPLLDLLNAEIVILTNAPRTWASRALNYLGLSDYQKMLFTGEGDLRKPNPLVFKQICDIKKISPEKTFSIGDQVDSDILPAKSIGIKTILIKNHSDEADYCIKSLKELPYLINKNLT